MIEGFLGHLLIISPPVSAGVITTIISDRHLILGLWNVLYDQ